LLSLLWITRFFKGIKEFRNDPLPFVGFRIRFEVFRHQQLSSYGARKKSEGGVELLWVFGKKSEVVSK